MEKWSSNAGIRLQYLDSMIAERVMLALAERNYPILPMHDSFIVHHGLEKDLQELMDKAFEEVMGVKGTVELKYNSITERQKRHEGPDEIGDVCILDLLRRGTHDVYEGLLSEHWSWVDMESKRNLQGLRDRGIDPYEDGFETVDKILNGFEPDPEDQIPF